MNKQEEKACPKCEHKMIQCYVDSGLKGLLVTNPEGDKLFSNRKNTTINPFICANCGFTEWYAAQVENLV